LNIAIGSGRRLRAAFAASLALTLLTTLAVVEAAGAATLSERQATRTAAKLVKKQLADRERDLVEARISVGERVNRLRFQFLYDDLNSQGEVCTGVIDVRRRGRTIRAAFLRGSSCSAPGADALAVRNTTRAAARFFARVDAKVRRSVRRYARATVPCESLEVPAARRDEATLLLGAGLVQATFRPIASLTDGYATALEALPVTDEQLRKGTAAWRDFVNSRGVLPALLPDACAVLVEWGANGFTDATAPVNFAELSTLMARMEADGAELRRTSRYLARLGIDPVTAATFSLDDLVGTAVVTGDEARKSAARVLAR
jgi:hypothetical protein